MFWRNFKLNSWLDKLSYSGHLFLWQHFKNLNDKPVDAEKVWEGIRWRANILAKPFRELPLFASWEDFLRRSSRDRIYHNVREISLPAINLRDRCSPTVFTLYLTAKLCVGMLAAERKSIRVSRERPDPCETRKGDSTQKGLVCMMILNILKQFIVWQDTGLCRNLFSFNPSSFSILSPNTTVPVPVGIELLSMSLLTTVLRYGTRCYMMSKQITWFVLNNHVMYPLVLNYISSIS